jgi:hypothetical protein
MTNSKCYTSIRGLFDLEIPEGWILVDDDEGIANFSSPSGTAAVTVSAAQHYDPTRVASACKQLRRYVKKLDIDPGGFKEIDCSVSVAIGEYIDKAGIYWRVMFQASANVVVLATYNREFSSFLQGEDQEAQLILSSVRAKARV